MTIRIKTGDPNTTVTLPESITVNGQAGGNPTLQVKDTDGVNRLVTSLFTKVEATTQNSGPQIIKIWPSPPSTQTTQPGTNDDGDGGNGQCGACTVGNEVWYPQLYSSSGSAYRWDCQVWNDTGKVDIQFDKNTTEVDNEYYSVYGLASGQTNLPPPPGYILGDYTTYTVPDWIYLYCKRGVLSLNNYGHFLGGSAISKDFYKFHLPPTGSSGPDVFDECPALCEEVCFSESCGEGASFCINECTTSTSTVPEIIDATDSLFNTSCTSTSFGCQNYCYTIPEPNSFYHCRNIQKILPSVNYNSSDQYPLLSDNGGLCSESIPDFAINLKTRYGTNSCNDPDIKQRGPIRYNDIGLLNDAGCLGIEGSAWHFRIFLPFYVKLPDSLIQKYIKFKENGPFPSHEDFYNQYPTTPTDVNKTLREAYDIISGRTFAAGFIYGKDTDSNQTIYWGAVGYPKEFTTSSNEYHTHVLVLEINNPISNECNVCVPGGCSTTPKYFGFYPITKSDKKFVDIFSDYMKYSIVLSNGAKYGIHNLKLLTDISSAESQLCVETDIGYYYEDALPGGFNQSPVTNFIGVSTSNDAQQLTLQKFITTYYPQKITVTQDTDCGCTQGIASLTAGTGLTVTDDTLNVGNAILLSISDSIIDNLETSVTIVESIIDTVTSTSSEGADGGTW